MTRVVLYLWQLPQHLLGLLLLFFLRGRVTARRRSGSQTVYCCFRKQGGISLGRYVFVHQLADAPLVQHELGHCRQSLMLGPLYLIVIGLPSILWAILFSVLQCRHPELDYFGFYTERWANQLAGLAIPERADDDQKSSSDGSGRRS